MDVSARTLITELAPWSSLVQRFGRCNRYGECNGIEGGANVFWVDLVLKDDKDATPYTVAGFRTARDLLAGRTLVGPRDLAGIHAPEPPLIRPVLRRKDLLDLFDTTPDLLGNDLDIARYVRDGEDTDAQVFWRVLPEKDAEVANAPAPVRAELCRVSVAALGDFFKKTKPRAFVWNALDGKWERLTRPRPGLVCLLDARAGGCRPTIGWTGQAGDPVPTPDASAWNGETPPRYGDNGRSLGKKWVTLADHTANAVGAVRTLAVVFGSDDDLTATLHTAARWHDVGKAHATFQGTLQEAVGAGDAPCPDATKLWAKSSGRLRPRAKERQGFRHELASALAWLQKAPAAAPARDLIAYLIACHHGRVRLSIRSLPDEKGPRDGSDCLFARGVWDADWLPGGDFAEVAVDGLTLPRFQLDLGYMQMGEDDRPDGRGPSWLARTLALRDDPALGPFRLAFLETLLRVADWRASEAEAFQP